MSRVQRALQHGRKLMKPTKGSQKKIQCPLCLIGLIMPVLALVCLLAVPAAADQLGRLFFSAEERAALEALRSGTDQDLIPPPVEVAVPPPTNDIAATDLYSLGGLVTRQKKLQAVWLNQQHYTLPALPENIRQDLFLGPEEILLQVPQRTESYFLRPGQRLDLNSNRVWEVYERGWQSATPISTEEGATPEESVEPQAAHQATSE